MARPITSARRYAEAAFEIAAARWSARPVARRSAGSVGDPRGGARRPRGREPGHPARRASGPGREAAREADRRQACPAGRPAGLARPRRRSLARVADEYRRLLQRHQGIVPAIVDQRRAARPTPNERGPSPGGGDGGCRRRPHDPVDPALLGGLTVRVGDRLIDGSVRGRLERLRDQLVPGPGPADASGHQGERHGHPLRRDHQHHQVGDRSVRRRRARRAPSGRSSRSATASPRSTGCEGALASELLEFPGGVMGMALNLEEETVGAVILGDYIRDQGRRHGQDHRPRRRGARRRRAHRPRRRPAGRAARRQGPDRNDEDPAGRAHRPRRHRPPGRGHAGPDRHQGDRRADPDRSRAARADHRRPPDRQDRDRDRHDHQPEGQAPDLHLRRHRPEALDGRADRRDAREVRRDGAHDRGRRRGRGSGARSSTSRPTPAPRWARRSWRTASRSAGALIKDALCRLRRPDASTPGRIARCRCCCAARPAARPTRATSSTSTAGCWSGRRGSATRTAAAR